MENLAAVLDQLDQLLGTFQFEEALQICEEALYTNQNNFDLLSCKANILLELGDLEQAREYLSKCLAINPNSCETLLNLAQMTSGEEALCLYQSGIQLLKPTEMEQSEYQLKMSSALCGMAEIYLTDCCELDQAEQECERCLNTALQLCPNNPDVLVTLASFRLSQEKVDEAGKFLHQFHQLIMAENPTESSVFDASYETRLNAVRLMIEAQVEAQLALDVLQTLERDDDECVDLHYLYALVWFHAKDFHSSLDALQEAKAILAKYQSNDVEMQAAISALEQELATANLETPAVEGEESAEEEEIYYD